MATAKTKTNEKPLIQIDDEVREMTDAEYAEYLQFEAAVIAIPTGE